MLIVGTAGHIDHGKTTLVGALTGIDTDRLQEEKRRGISIDLGFAHMAGPYGEQLSFIDVPGHERFVKNMLAGAGGIGAVLLVVAADEGVKPQTREHFEICRMLRIPVGLIALTKADLATSDQLAATVVQVSELVRGSFLQDSPVLVTSTKTGLGLDQLRQALFSMAQSKQTRSSRRLARLHVDRSFAAKGFGAVVTGTLLSGELQVGETIQVHEPDRTARIRGLQVHGKTVTRASAGQRTAVNLSGIEHSELERGAVLTHVNPLGPTALIDAAVEWLQHELIPTKREHFLLYIGTAEMPVHLKMIGPGRARLWLSRPTVALPDDRFILRRPSPAATVGGGSVLDAFPPARLNRTKIYSRLDQMDGKAWSQRLEFLVRESPIGREISYLTKRTGLSPDEIRSMVASGSTLRIAGDKRVVSTAAVESSTARLLEWLQLFHKQHPNLPGAPLAQARLQVEPELAGLVLVASPQLRVAGEVVALSQHAPAVNSDHLKMLAKIESAFRQAGITPPAPATILQSAGADSAKGRPFLEALVKAQRLVRVSEDIVFHVEVVAQIRRALSPKKGSRFSVSEFKEWTQVSRKYAIPLLEYFDRQHVTRREGDARIVL